MRNQPRSITQMQNLPTAYEVALYDRDGKMIDNLGYFARRTKTILWIATQSNGEFIRNRLTEEELDLEVTYSKARGISLGGGAVSVRFSGMTERDRAQEIGKL